MTSLKIRLHNAKQYLQSGQSEKALPISLSLLQTHPENYNAHVLHAAILSSLKQTCSAQSALRTAISLRPQHPLAHKALIHLLVPPFDPPTALLLAHSHLALSTHSPDPHHLQSAATLFQLADDPLQPPNPHEISLLQQFTSLSSTTRLVNILLRSSDPAHRILLQSTLDLYHASLSPLSIPPPSPALSALSSRLQAAYQPDQHTVHIPTLQSISAHHSILHLAEHHPIPHPVLLQSAFRALHINPIQSPLAKAHLAAALSTTRPETALQLVVAPSSSSNPPSSTTALVHTALLHTSASHHHAIRLANLGLSFNDRHNPSFRLLLASSHAALRQTDLATAQIQLLLADPTLSSTPWLHTAASILRLRLAVRAFGRASRRATLAIEEAAATLFGRIEAVWTDALAGRVDLDHIHDLACLAVKEIQLQSDRPDASWEYFLLRDPFLPSPNTLAATAYMRAAQMLMSEWHADPQSQHSGLEEAQKLQMKAASFCKQLAGPFAHLGWIFERMYQLNKRPNVRLRALRCYEKAVSIDPAHPLAARRLAALLVENGHLDAASSVALHASNTNPKACWAHLISGWIRIRQHAYVQAAVSFRNALRANFNPLQMEREALFGTVIIDRHTDNPLVLHVDSWRGLAASYRAQAQIGPALSCTQDALSILQAPFKPYHLPSSLHVPKLRDDLLLLVHAERAALLQMQKTAHSPVQSIQSLVDHPHAPVGVKIHLSEAYLHLAAEHWLSGSYNRATLLRQKAATGLALARKQHADRYVSLNPTSLYKRLADAWMQVSSTHPTHLSPLVPIHILDHSISQARAAYANALHFSPWNPRRRQDVAAVLLRDAMLHSDQTLAQYALSFLMRSHSTPPLLAIALLVNASLASTPTLSANATRLAVRLSKSHMDKDSIELNASLAIHSAASNDLAFGTDAAVAAIRKDPTDWRGWFAVATIRECDARAKQWSQEETKSSEHAYREADRLGGGPPAVIGRVRCLEKLLENASDGETLLADAAFCSATAARAGCDASAICKDVFRRHAEVVEREAKQVAGRLQTERSVTDIYRHVHMFPFIPEVRALPLDGAGMVASVVG